MNVRQAEVSELLPQHFDELLPDAMLQVIVLEFESLLYRCIPSDGTDVHHSIPKLHEGATLNR